MKAEVRELDALGLVVIPAAPKSKAPESSWRGITWAQSHRRLEQNFKDETKNVWVLCGKESGGLVVIDCDNQEAVEWWASRLGEVIWQTARVKTSKGFHFWFRLADGEESFSGWNHTRVLDEDRDGALFDVRCDGGGVIAPPSVHESGHVYAWERPLRHMAVVKREAVSLSREAPGTPREPRSTLSGLLAAPATEGGRNDWLARVAGHYAKLIPHRDAYDELVAQANASLDDPLTRTELRKTADSIWRLEMEKPDEQQPEESNGWLVAREGKLYTKVRDKDGEHWESWSNFEPRVLGVVESETERAYLLDLYKGDKRVATEQLLSDRVLSRNIELEQWFMARRCHVHRPLKDVGRGNERARLAMYLDSRQAPVRKIATSLGWHDGHEFLTLEGAMTPDGLIPSDEWTPDPRLKSWAPYRYGFEGTREEAYAVFREVLTFHEYKPTAVAAAWMAALTMKGFKGWRPSLFPYLALEAPSESGKTKGAFAMLAQLFGYKGDAMAATVASFRDSLTAHRSSLIWVDDLDDPMKYEELLRQVSVEGSTQKKSNDNTSQETRRLVAVPFISGETLGSLMAEKAQRDRSIRIVVKSPRARLSQRPGEPHAQWDDMVDVWDRYGGDLTRISGWIVSGVLGKGPTWVGRFKEIREEKAGRHQDNMAILKTGARILSSMLDYPAVNQRVDKWVSVQENTGAENVLTHEVLPRLLSIEGEIRRSPHLHLDRPVPVWMDASEEIWFSPQLVSHTWYQIYRPQQGDRSLTTAKSLLSQWQALNVGMCKAFHTLPRSTPNDKTQKRDYYSLSLEISRSVMERAGLMKPTETAGNTAPPVRVREHTYPNGNV